MRPLHSSATVVRKVCGSGFLGLKHTLIGTVSIATWFINYTVETRKGSTPAFAAKLLAGAQAAFTVGRFSGTLIMHHVKPRKVFLAYLSGVIIFLAAACGARGNAGVCELYCRFERDISVNADHE